MCPNCPAMKEFMENVEMKGEFVDATTPEGLEEAKKYNITSVPMVIFFEDDKELGRAHTKEEVKEFI